MSFDFNTLITDRSQADVDSLSALLAKPLGTWTPEELNNFNNGLFKGGYWWTDLNRVTACMKYLDEELRKLGYESGYTKIQIRPDIPKYEDKNTILLLHGESLLDSSIYNAPVSNNGVLVSEDQSKFGSKSLFFDGQSYLSVKMSDIGLDFNSNWTFDWWEYTETDLTLASAVICMPNGNAGFILGSPLSYKNIRVFAGNDGGWGFVKVSTIGDFIKNRMVHRAICKEGTAIRCFQDGILYATLSTAGRLTNQETLYIGYRKTTTNYGGFIGYIDEFRISNMSRWNVNFTPPDSPYVVKGELISLDPYLWYKEDSPTIPQLNQYLENVQKLKSTLTQIPGIENVPNTARKFTTQKANDIEKILISIGEMVGNIKRTVNLGWALGISHTGLYGGV